MNTKTSTASIAGLALSLVAAGCSEGIRPNASATLPPETTAQCGLVAGHEGRIAAGQQVYGGSCIHCHGADGRGVAGSVPPLAGSTRLADRPMLAVNAVVINQASTGPVHGMQYQDMVAALGSLTAEEIASVLSYVMTAWGNCNAIVEPEQVAARRRDGA